MGSEDSKRPRDLTLDGMRFADSKRPLSGDRITSASKKRPDAEGPDSKRPILSEEVEQKTQKLAEYEERAEQTERQVFLEQVRESVDKFPRKIREFVEAAGDRLEEAIKDPRFKRMVSLGLAAVMLATAVSARPKSSNASAGNERKSFAASASSAESISETITIDPDLNTEITPENMDQFADDVLVSELVEKAGKDSSVGGKYGVEGLEDFKLTADNSATLIAAKRFVRIMKEGPNGEGKVLGQERQDRLEEYLTESISELASLARIGKVSDEKLQERAEIIQKAYQASNELVNAGYAKDVVRAAIKSGMMSREAAEEAKKVLFEDDRKVRVDLDSMKVTLEDGEEINIHGGARILNLIGNGPIGTDLPHDADSMSIKMDMGSEIKNLVDLDKLDPAMADKLRKNEPLITNLVENAWPGIEEKLIANGEKITPENRQLFIDGYVQSVVTGEAQKIDLGTETTASYESITEETENMRLATEASSEISDYLQSKPFIKELNITIMPVEETETKHAVATINADVRVIGGRVAETNGCKANYLIIVQINGMTLVIKKAVQKEIISDGAPVVFDRIVVIPPAVGSKGEGGLPAGAGVGRGYADFSPKDRDFGRLDIKEKTKRRVGSQFTNGGNSYAAGANDKAVSIGRINRNQEGRKAGENKRSQERHK